MTTKRNYQHPSNRRAAWLANWIANHRALRNARRWLLQRLPFPVLESDVRDIVYLNWVVPLARVAAWVPPGVELNARDGETILTVLSYRHGHFGPRLLGPLRRMFPSPLQSNWRFYVSSLHGRAVEQPTVLFIKNYFDNGLYAVGTRTGSDALPSDLAGVFRHGRSGHEVSTRLQRDTDRLEFESEVVISSQGRLPTAFARFFSSWEEAVAMLSLQDSAVVQTPDLGCLAQADIALPIDQESVAPLAATHYLPGPLLQALGASGEPFCFFVPHVNFQVLSERLLPAR
ncbi:DUF2071 domain-containing protein [Alkalilimnicola ehrlichii]|uniref:DUF2071 domain-containing protein n=1 Tax=Alkalilimnicola ehrlichii TaxID=351052 RepID=UPI001C6F277E|nr:DUF2071 domain-containing protein [Alkalilimnicola ehrlichii]